MPTQLTPKKSFLLCSTHRELQAQTFSSSGGGGGGGHGRRSVCWELLNEVLDPSGLGISTDLLIIFCDKSANKKDEFSTQLENQSKRNSLCIIIDPVQSWWFPLLTLRHSSAGSADQKGLRHQQPAAVFIWNKGYYPPGQLCAFVDSGSFSQSRVAFPPGTCVPTGRPNLSVKVKGVRWNGQVGSTPPIR